MRRALRADTAGSRGAPALFVEGITVSAKRWGITRTATATGKIDTGAFMTAIPLDLVERLGLSVSGWREIRGFDDEHEAEVYPEFKVTLTIPGIITPFELKVVAC